MMNIDYRFEQYKYKMRVEDIDKAIENVKKRAKIIDNDFEDIGDRDIFIGWCKDPDSDIQCVLVPESRGFGAHEACYQWIRRYQKNRCGISTAKRNQAEYRFTI